MELIAKLLTEAVEGEIAAEKRYRAFASQADDAGYTGIAVLFRGLAQAEAVHITNHQQALKKNNSTPPDPAVNEKISRATVAENIAAAVAAENEEITSMYPSFIKEIR
ncbi:MAG: ferritin family protein, partial [Desulfobia sp.]